MGKRRRAREMALQTLYLMDTARLPLKEAFRISTDGTPDMDEDSVQYALKLAQGTRDCLTELDRHIQDHAANWELGRMAAVDRNLLRLAAYELVREPETPIRVIINEALEIAKKYSSEDSSRFVNGILDKIKDYRAAPEPEK